MTTLDTSICWAVLAPLSTGDLEQVSLRERVRDLDPAFSIDPPPWQTLAGTAGYNALVSRSPGTEGSDRRFAEILSQRAPGKSVYALWLDPERRQAFEWKDGREVTSPAVYPDAIAEQLGFRIATDSLPERMRTSAAVVEGASIDEVRHALGDAANEAWLHVRQGPAGAVITATDGPLGTQAWDVAEALPSATVYHVQQWANVFEVLVLKGLEEAGQFRVPAPDDDSDADTILDIKGETAPSEILRVLGIPADTLTDISREIPLADSGARSRVPD
jgi:hypothetical protein